MPPLIATFLYVAGIALLFRLDRDPTSRTSPALWIPVAWLLIGASRPVSQWFGAPLMRSADQYLEGSPLDALIFMALEVAAVMVLVARHERSAAFLRGNGALLVFFVYCAVSIVWSDYPEVAFKRWTKAVGNVLMVLVVLTDSEPRVAVRGVLARAGFVLLPLSVLTIKYYPEFGRGFDAWTGRAYNSGVALDKNGLGVICLIFGLGSLWRLLTALRERPRTARPLIAHGTVLAAAVWLFSMADSATSLGCFIVGGALIALTLHPRALRPMALHVFTAGIVFVGLLGVLVDTDVGLVQMLGRDSTLTTRTELWDELRHFDVDPVFGTGFESFWLGERVEFLWGKYWWHPNQAHNGYLETYLNLGCLGLALLGFVMAQGYRNVLVALRQDRELGRLRLAYFVAAVLYNLTEAAFKVVHPIWVIFILAVMRTPPPTRPVVPDARTRAGGLPLRNRPVTPRVAGPALSRGTEND